MLKTIVNVFFSMSIIMLLSSSNVLAQGNGRGNAYGRGNGNDGPGNSSNAPGQNKPTGVPIDGGAGALLAAGAAYGFKKLRDHYKSKKIT